MAAASRIGSVMFGWACRRLADERQSTAPALSEAPSASLETSAAVSLACLSISLVFWSSRAVETAAISPMLKPNAAPFLFSQSRNWVNFVRNASWFWGIRSAAILKERLLWRFRILDFGFWTLSRSSIPLRRDLRDFGFWTLDFVPLFDSLRRDLRGFRFWTLDFGFWIGAGAQAPAPP